MRKTVTRLRPWLIGVLLAGAFTLLCVNIWDSTHTINLLLNTSSRRININIQLVCWLGFTASVLLLTYLPKHVVPAVVIAGGLVLGTIGVSAQPNTSNDSSRYNWDGIVQLHGISPYKYVPANDHLANLRTSWLFPQASSDGNGHPVCPAYSALTPTITVNGGTGGYLCTTINRPLVPTIYPPVAEVLFAGVRAVVPDTAMYMPMQLFGLACVLLTTGLLLWLLRRQGRNLAWAGVWAWCPLVINQAVTNAHIDVAGAPLAILATVMALRGRRFGGGLLFGAAIMTKFLPGIMLLPLLRRKPWVLLAGVIASIAVGYGLYLLGGTDVFGYLGGYLTEEGYDNGTRSALVGMLVPGAWVTPLAAAIFLIALMLLWRYGDEGQPWVNQLVLFGTALFLASPRYPWYALLLVPLIALAGRWEWFALVLVLVYRQFDARVSVFQDNLMYALLVIGLVTIARQIWNKPVPPGVIPDARNIG